MSDQPLPGPESPKSDGPGSPKSESSSPLEYVVRFGSMRTLGVMSAKKPFRYGDEVVARSNRGTEIGTVLCEATPTALDSMTELWAEAHAPIWLSIGRE